MRKTLTTVPSETKNGDNILKSKRSNEVRRQLFLGAEAPLANTMFCRARKMMEQVRYFLHYRIGEPGKDVNGEAGTGSHRATRCGDRCKAGVGEWHV